VVGGNVELESTPGQGTVVRVTLRLAEQEAA
jgi:signal transduction histidine kinase